MNTQANAIPAPAATISRGQLLYWSIRRELMEYRSIYLAPLAIGGVVVLGFAFVLVHLPRMMRAATILGGTTQQEAVSQPFDAAAGLIMAAAFIVSIYYALDTLYGERRDRTILFWKSLPVSDLTAVLAKTCVLLLVLPVVAFVVTVVAEAIVVGLSGAVLAFSGLSVAKLWAILEPIRSMTGLLYHLVTVHILWYAPLYAWLMLISAWSRRAPLLWAALPPFAIVIFERVAFHTKYFADFLLSRVGGTDGTGHNMLDVETKMSPGHFMLTPGLWWGLLFAAAFLLVAARLRRYRGPI
jgi:ABC-2 type transport system permease protein